MYVCNSNGTTRGVIECQETKGEKVKYKVGQNPLNQFISYRYSMNKKCFHVCLYFFYYSCFYFFSRNCINCSVLMCPGFQSQNLNGTRPLLLLLLLLSRHRRHHHKV